MKKKKMNDALSILILIASVASSESLDCHSCSNVINTDGCNGTMSCPVGQSCYRNVSLGEQNLGCVDNQRCDSHAAVSTIVGRSVVSRKASTCFECCSTDRCNIALCQHQENKVCMDDESVDCARLNSIFSICKDVAHARSVCAKFCGLCIVDGNWTLWSTWTACDVTCGNGHQLRSRFCTNPSPQNGGLACVGDRIMAKVCKTEQSCPIHGGWSDWSSWGTCSVTCDMGLQCRTRICSNPPPSLAGKPCFGENTDSQLCMPVPCANGGWSDWTSWTSCSATCGGGIRSQTRSCSNPFPSPYGQNCVGTNDRVEMCAKNNCEKNYCSTSPCVHGQCYDVSNDFLCYCDHGYEGRYCNISDYYCKSNPCDHGSCVSGISDYTCNCFEGYVGRNCDLSRNVTDCFDILHKNISSKSGVYNVFLWRSKVVKEIYCDMETDKGGWTVFQYRFNGSVDFYRNFSDYKRGFGSLDGEFWLGLENIYEMVSRGKTELRLDLTAADGTTVYETFQNFTLGEKPYYTLHIDQGVGTAGDSLSYNNGRHFTTFDMDRDRSGRNCAIDSHGGWWYDNCANANLNGEYVTPGTQRPGTSAGGMIYYSFKGGESLKVSKMMFRRI